jgi:hypothetical protein
MMKSFLFSAALFLWPWLATAQLAVTVLPLKLTGQKVVVPLVMKNNFSENIASARAVCFLLDDKGKMVGQSTQWVIGKTPNSVSGQSHGLSPGDTNVFHFVVTAAKPFTTTNLTAKLSFNRIVLQGGRTANPQKDVQVTQASAASP